jgi:DNA-binding response OmpR family regulator
LRVKKEVLIPENGDSITMGKYQFHLNKQVLTNGSTERKLSYREAELVKYLYRHKNDVIDRRDLLNHIWGNDSFFNSRNLDVYITKIRGYLKEDASLEIITIKGVGYRFVV